MWKQGSPPPPVPPTHTHTRTTHQTKTHFQTHWSCLAGERLYSTCFPITSTGLFLWHSLRENILDWLLVMTGKSLVMVNLRAGWYPLPASNSMTALHRSGRFTSYRPVCLTCLQWLTEDLGGREKNKNKHTYTHCRRKFSQAWNWFCIDKQGDLFLLRC